MKNSAKKFVIVINNHTMYVNSLKEYDRLNRYATNWRQSSFAINTKKFKINIGNHICMVDTEEEGRRLYSISQRMNVKFSFNTWNNISSTIRKTATRVYFIFPWQECSTPLYIIDSGNERENNRRQDIANGCPKHLAGMAY